MAIFESIIEEFRQQKDGQFFVASESLAKAWLNLGKTDKAIRILEDASPYKNEMGGVISRIWWLQIQLHLADLYSQSGRQTDADKILIDLRKLLAYADSDYWMVKELNRKASVRSNLPR